VQLINKTIEYLDLWFVKSLPGPIEVDGSKLSFFRNVFLSQYREQKCLMWNGPKQNRINLKLFRSKILLLKCGAVPFLEPRFYVEKLPKRCLYEKFVRNNKIWKLLSFLGCVHKCQWLLAFLLLLLSVL